MNFDWSLLIPIAYIGAGLTVLVQVSRRHADLTAFDRLVIVVGWFPMGVVYALFRIALAIVNFMEHTK